MEAPNSIWVETRITDEGISITLLSESLDGAVVEDETWFTFDEMNEMAPSAPISLNLSNETREILRRNSRDHQQKDIEEVIDELEGPDLPEEGDVLLDQDPPSWSPPRPAVTVTEVKEDVRADQYVANGLNEGLVIHPSNQEHGDRSVADLNPRYREDDAVIIGTYPDSDNEYAFPVSRLEE